MRTLSPKITGVTLMALALYLASMVGAGAHDQYAWIKDGRYLTDSGVHCCGPKDCGRIPEHRYKLHADGSATVRLPNGQSVLITARAVYKSKDPFARYCRPGCLFYSPRLF